MISPITAVVEAGIREHHVLSISYVDRFGQSLVILAEPYGYKTNRAGHVVLWIWNVERGKFEELVAVRMAEARDTGEVFVPRPEWHGLEEVEGEEV